MCRLELGILRWARMPRHHVRTLLRTPRLCLLHRRTVSAGGYSYNGNTASVEIEMTLNVSKEVSVRSLLTMTSTDITPREASASEQGRLGS
jgi:hypothetical protein